MQNLFFKCHQFIRFCIISTDSPNYFTHLSFSDTFDECFVSHFSINHWQRNSMNPNKKNIKKTLTHNELAFYGEAGIILACMKSAHQLKIIVLL